MVDLVTQPDLPVTLEPVGSGRARHQWRSARWMSWPLSPGAGRERSFRGTLRRLDDDPVLLCDCAEGAPHTCG